MKKLIEKAETLEEAIAIQQLGTMWKKTGFSYDVRLEKMTDDIYYFKKDEKLSFTQPEAKQTHKLIIGDNYKALINLQQEYQGKIKMIYIDPPYGKDSMGQFAKTNYKNNITRDNLLSMLEPRLRLARNLLSDDGVIFCSIDDKNQAYVKILFDEVFGEGNFVKCLVWESGKPFGYKATTNTWPRCHEYILHYAKNINHMHYQPTYTTEKSSSGEYILTSSIIKAKENQIYSMDWVATANKESVNVILGVSAFNNGQKPTSLIKKLLMSSTDKNSIILDFFAGSGTTGQAVLEQNKLDGGNRQFILVQLDEPVEGIQKEFCEKNNLPLNLASITYERLKRVMTGIASDGSNFKWLEKNEKLGDNLLVCEVSHCANFDKNVFENIDETLYGIPKFEKPIDKINWVCDNFEGTQIKMYKKKIEDGKEIEDYEIASEGGFTATEIEEAKKKTEQQNNREQDNKQGFIEE